MCMNWNTGKRKGIIKMYLILNEILSFILSAFQIIFEKLVLILPLIIDNAKRTFFSVSITCLVKKKTLLKVKAIHNQKQITNYQNAMLVSKKFHLYASIENK